MADKEKLYAVRWEGADDEHLGMIGLSVPSLDRANAAAARIYKNVKILQVMSVTGEQLDKMKKDLLAKYAARIPIDEKTGGVPELALHKPELLADENV